MEFGEAQRYLSDKHPDLSPEAIGSMALWVSKGAPVTFPPSHEDEALVRRVIDGLSRRATKEVLDCATQMTYGALFVLRYALAEKGMVQLLAESYKTGDPKGAVIMLLAATQRGFK